MLLVQSTGETGVSATGFSIYDMGSGWGSCTGAPFHSADPISIVPSASVWKTLANGQLYCQNLSLFGKLFIDHKVRSCYTAS
jgi:hypothetical protein